jgi:hypothetical protein
MDRLDQDLFRQFPTVDGRPGAEGVAVVEFSAIGTAIAALAADDPRRSSKPMSGSEHAPRHPVTWRPAAAIPPPRP